MHPRTDEPVAVQARLRSVRAVRACIGISVSAVRLIPSETFRLLRAVTSCRAMQ